MHHNERKLDWLIFGIIFCLVVAVVLFLIGIAYSQESSSVQMVRKYFTNRSMEFNRNMFATPTMDLDFDQDPSGASITAEGSSAFVLTKNGSPTRLEDATWPDGISGSQGYGHKFDGDTPDYYTCADGTCEADPAGDFSVMIVFTTFDNQTNQKIMAKGKAASYCYAVFILSGSIYIGVSDDGSTGGGHWTAVGRGSVTIGARHVLFATYDYVTDGSSIINVYLDGQAVGTSSVADGPPYDTSDEFAIGAKGDGSEPFYGIVHHSMYWDGVVLTSTQIQTIRYAMQGRLSLDGTIGNALTISGAAAPSLVLAPPASGTEPFLIRMPANTSWVGSPVTGAGGIPNLPSITNLPFRTSICESQDVSNHPSGWTTTEGGGSDVDCVTSTYANGGFSVEIVQSTPADTTKIESSCITDGIGSDLYLEFYGKDTGGSSELDLVIEEYDAADCTSSLGTTNILSNQELTTSWAVYGGAFASGSWDGSTSSYKVYFYETANSITEYIDAPLFRVGTYGVLEYGSCSSDTDSSAACNPIVSSVSNMPIQTGGSTWTFKVDVLGSWVGNDSLSHRFFASGAAANDILIQKAASNFLTCIFYDSGGTARQATEAVDGVDWAADTTHTVVCTRHLTGNVSGYLDGTALTTLYTGGEAHQTAIDESVYLGSTNDNLVTMGWLSDITFYRGSTND